MSLVTSSAFQLSPAIQTRSFVSLSILATSDVDDDLLYQMLVALKKEAFNLRFQQATGQLESTARMRAVRRDVARVKTILNQKAAEAAASN